MIEPASAPVTVLVATPRGGGALRRAPVTVPVPPVLAKVTLVELSPVTMLPSASRTSAVSDRVAPEVRLVGGAGEGEVVGRAGDDVKVVVTAVSPVAVAAMVIVPASTPVTVLVATPVDGGGGAERR